MVNKVELVANGIKVSELVQGYYRMTDWEVDRQSLLSFIKAHMDLGITSIDHAHVYGDPACEEVFGNALKLQPSLRQDMQLITKFGIIQAQHTQSVTAHYNSDNASIMASVDSSLKRLQTDYIDILLMHRPDLLMDADEVADTFKTLQKQGKVRHFGVSNFTVAQFELLQSRLEQPLVTNQIEINPVNLESLEDGTLEQAQRLRARPMAWSLMAGGRMFKENTDKNFRLRTVLTEVMDEINAQSMDQVVYAWVRKLPAKPVAIIGSGKIDRVQSAVDSLAFNMTHEQWYRIWVASKGHGVA
ncbi:MAG: aldo/keto reductase [Pseudomonadales bacterium]|nr:aldo/keto reductase [Pseudomonadales bacterium]NRA16233.1 aldo/keto reductase [Oceanospirillaceae bacterium]